MHGITALTKRMANILRLNVDCTGGITEGEWQETVAKLKNIHMRIREKLSTRSDQVLIIRQNDCRKSTSLLH